MQLRMRTIEQGDGTPPPDASLEPTAWHAAVSAVVLSFAMAQASAAPAQADPGGGVSVHQLDVREAAFGDARIGEREVGLALWSPEFGFDRFAFGAAAHYAYVRYEYDGLPSRARDLHQLHLPLQWRGHEDRWRVVLTPVIAASSNVFKDLFKRGSRDDFDVYGRWQYERWTDERRGWRVALVRDAAFGAPRLYPAAALLWRGERVSAELGLPDARVQWRALDRSPDRRHRFPHRRPLARDQRRARGRRVRPCRPRLARRRHRRLVAIAARARVGACRRRIRAALRIRG